MPETLICPETPVLERLLLGKLPSAEAELLGAHLLQCPRCATAAAQLPAEDGLVEAMRAQATSLPRAAVPTVERLMQQLSRLRIASATDTQDTGAEIQVQAATPPPTGHSSAGWEVSPSAVVEPRPSAPAAAGRAAAGPGAARAKTPSFSFLAPSQGPDEIGRLGPYRILQVLGQGGMGLVFQALDTHLQRPVALKVMKPDLAEESVSKQRFLREARAAAAIEHDHIVTIYQVGEENGLPFLAMQLLRGEPLDKRLERDGPLPVPEVLRIGRETARGLAAAHARGMIHRDIKPGNIWLEVLADERGVSALRVRVKLLDFGLARSAQDPQTRLTKSGFIVGTPAYMAPEQARGETVDARADLFSLGCVLYQMATGRLPFTGKDTLAILYALANDHPLPPQTINPDVPLALAELITRLLAKDPAHRPASAREVAEQLEAIERQPAVPLAASQAAPAAPKPATRPLGPPVGTGWARRPRAAWLLAGSAAVLLLVSVSIVQMMSRRPDAVSSHGSGASTTPAIMGRHPDGRPLLHDFGLKVEPLGGALDPAGQLLLKLKDKIAFRVQVERDCYVGVFMIDDQGQIMMLFPNQDEKDHLLRGGQPRTIPGKPEYWIEALAVSRGPEYVHVFASTKHWEPPAGHRGPNDRFDAFVNEAQRNELQLKLRALGLARPDPNKIDPKQAVAEAVMRFQVRPAD